MRTDRPADAVDPAAAAAALGRQLSVAVDGDVDGGLALARAFVLALSARARLVLDRALSDAETDAETGTDTGTGADARTDAGTHADAGAPADAPATALADASHGDPPDGLVRLRFADATALERAAAAFGAGAGAGLGEAWTDPATLTLQIPGDAGVETLRTVLAVLDAAAITSESLTVHTRELDDVLAAFTTLV
ncbi:hypothetical protein ACIRP0_30735 [Streptomyces sp. NPDC101733]|uniref:hypothetical protein n=1 Tax=unclassified Streptomyces TaxID=2593676 RepID=UPI003824593C